MKNIKYFILVIVATFVVQSCNKDLLDLENPNSPGLPAMKTEEGLKRFGLGIYNKFALEYWWLSIGYHNVMGDTFYIPWGNFSWRWANQTSQIILSDGTVLTPPQGTSQPEMLKSRNDRSFGNDNAFYNEWVAMYMVNNHANVLLDVLNSGEVTFAESGEIKTKILEAWAYWWKGFAYSRLGSLYVAGIITSEADKTNSDFVTSAKLIEEANSNFDKAIAVLSTLSASDTYNTFFTGLIPDFTNVGNGGVLTPEMWIRSMNTYKARNLLVNTYADDMTAAQWNEILTLTGNGIKETDKIFTLRSALTNDLVSETAWWPYRSLIGWDFISERLVQDFKSGDARKDRNIYTLSSPRVNQSGRGYQYGTRFGMIDITSGGNYASTTAGEAEIPIACSYEENQLMMAEALIHTADIEGGLGYIDEVRTYQNSELANVVGTGLSETQALEELRKERRIGLIKNGVSFYDARRWKVILPLSQGGGRTNAVVVGPSAVIDENATIEYNYMPYWDVPMNELDFNEPSSASAPVSTQ